MPKQQIQANTNTFKRKICHNIQLKGGIERSMTVTCLLNLTELNMQVQWQDIKLT